MKSRKRKAAKAPLLAAGGIVLRHGARPLIAIVQRRKDNRWVLPKGKLKRRENVATGARREAVEETGQNVRVHEFLGAITYESRGRPKVSHFWRMQTRDGPPRELARDIKAVEWLSLSDAIERLTHPIERSFLGAVGRQTLRGARIRRRAGKRRTMAQRKLLRKMQIRRRKPQPHKTRSNPTLLRRLFRRLSAPHSGRNPT